MAGWLVAIIMVLAVVLLGAALAYGTMHYRHYKTRRELAAEKAAVERLYHSDRQGEI